MATLSAANYVAFPNALPRLMTAVPTSLTDICTTTAHVYQVHVSNTTAGALTFLLQDKQATPGQLVPSVSIAANTAYILTWPEGQQASGISVQGSGAGLQVAFVGSYK